MKRTVWILVLVLAAISGIVADLAVKRSKPDKEPLISEISSRYSETRFSESSTADLFAYGITAENNQSETGVFESQLSTDSLQTDRNRADSADSTDTSAPETDISVRIIENVTERITEFTEQVTSLTAVISKQFGEVFKMPKAPKYIPPDVKIDFDKTELLSYKYDPNGNYYYTDDKNAWQKGFGYNQIYDKLAVVSAMYYDTVRTTFRYDNKDWLLQIWKGQYGYYFVGGEIGLYNKTGKGSTYACAGKEDWVKMEMTFFWDEQKNGNYQPVFTRPYDDYWWCTGFVVGFESVESFKSREQFRIVAHITFKTTEMAELFSEAFESNGFRRVGVLDNYEKDTFVQVGPDVAFVWQSINQHVI